MISAIPFVALGAFLFFVLSARRKAPKGQLGEKDIQFSLPAAFVGALVGLVGFCIFSAPQESRPSPPPESVYTRDLPNTADSVGVRGHYRSDGTYVPPHRRSYDDGNPWNNWSTSGNANPYTGERGTRIP